MRTPATSTASGDARPAKDTSSASVKATVDEGATLATDATVSSNNQRAPARSPVCSGPPDAPTFVLTLFLPTTVYALTAWSAMARASLMTANPSSNCSSVMQSGGLVITFHHRIMV